MENCLTDECINHPLSCQRRQVQLSSFPSYDPALIKWIYRIHMYICTCIDSVVCLFSETGIPPSYSCSVIGAKTFAYSGVLLLYVSAWLALWSLVVYMSKIWKVLLRQWLHVPTFILVRSNYNEDWRSEDLLSKCCSVRDSLASTEFYPGTALRSIYPKNIRDEIMPSL